MNVISLENRIKRLAFEADRNNKLAEFANEKAKKILQARDRHAHHIIEKFNRRDNRM